MPHLSVETNVELDAGAQKLFLQRISEETADMLGKSEAYVMVSLRSGVSMSFAGESEPAMFMQLKSIGLPEGEIPAFSNRLCKFVQQQLGIPTRRIYIEFTAVQRQLWGWDGRTF